MLQPTICSGLVRRRVWGTNAALDRIASLIMAKRRESGLGVRAAAAEVAVGTRVTPSPPHRSRRAALPHRALTLSVWRQRSVLRDGGDDFGVVGATGWRPVQKLDLIYHAASRW
jgi:hypothetical protein